MFQNLYYNESSDKIDSQWDHDHLEFDSSDKNMDLHSIE